MDERAGSRRRYGDREVGLILKRAAELQRQEPTSAAEGGGLTLSDLEEIAAEAGIDPRLLRQAAAEIESGDDALMAEGLARVLGAPPTIKLERSVSGELPEADFERLVPEIQAAAESHGQASLLGRTLTWRSSTPQNERSLQVTITARGGRTRITIEERLHGLAGGLFGGLLGGVGGGVGFGVGFGVGLGALGSVAFAVLFPVAVIGGSYAAARTLFTSMARNRHRRLRDLLERLTEHVEAVSNERSRTELPGG